MKSILKRPVLIQEGRLYLRYGIMAETEIEIKNIAEVALFTREIEFDDNTRRFSPLGAFESHNLIIRLKDKTPLTGLYGIKRNFRELVLHLDEPGLFKEQIDKQLE